MKKLIKYLKPYFYCVITACMLLFCEHALAQPGNNTICNATTLPVNGTCVAGTTVAAEADYYGGCVVLTNISVWYKFTLTAPNNMIDITFNTYGSITEFQTFLFDGPTCNNPNGIYTICQAPSITFSFFGLTAGTTYWLLVSTTPAQAGTFNICGAQAVRTGTTGPEQDCIGAIPVCNTTYTQGNSYLGYGDIDEVPGTTCLLAGETNSMWYVFTVQPGGSGSLTFTITTAKDYDFALYDITTIGCSGIPGATPVRCNWSDDLGNTGLNTPTQPKLPALSVSWNGSAMMAGITTVNAGETYVLIIDNWTGDQNGYSITFGGTAVIVDATPPALSSATPSCTNNTILVTMSEAIQCLTVAQNDFTLTNTTTSTNYTGAIIQVLGYNCPSTNGAMTNQIQITHNGTLTSGIYKLEIAANPSLADKCGNVIVAGGFVTFNYLAPFTLTPSASTVCPPGTVNLTVNNGPPSTTVTLNPGGLSGATNVSGSYTFSGVSVSATTNYTASITYGGCTKTASQTITLQNNVVVSISPIDPQVCPTFTADLTATTTIGGVACTDCNYSWNAGAFTQNGVASSTWTNRPAGTYTVTATTSAGCVSNTASSTVSEASGTPGTCNIYYVNTDGVIRDGLTKATPTTLADALTKAACTNSIIKMAVGIYNLTNRQIVSSYLTIEGGYAADFLTKSSNMSGTTNSTTIRRSNAVDSDDPNGCTAFKVNNNSTAFRFQDLRIEMPGSPNVTAHTSGSPARSNYGIRMGTGCTSYYIVRCYINAGTGSN